MLVITELVLVAIAVIIVIFLIKLLKKLFRFRVPVKKYDEVVKQVRNLQRDLLRANYEKDRLLQMKVAELGVSQEQLESEVGEGEEKENGEYVPSSNRNTLMSPPVDPAESRFSGLPRWIISTRPSTSLLSIIMILHWQRSATGSAAMLPASWGFTMISA